MALPFRVSDWFDGSVGREVGDFREFVHALLGTIKQRFNRSEHTLSFDVATCDPFG